PEQRAVGQGSAGERRGDVDTVARKLSALLPATRGDERRQPVHRDDRDVAAASRGDPAGPANDGRYAQSTFEQLGLLAGERPGVAEALAAVVAGEHNDRVAVEAQFGEPGEYPTDVVVQRLHHLRVPLERATIVVEDRAAGRGEPCALYPAFLVVAFLQPVRRREVLADEKRLAVRRAAFERADRRVCEQVSRVAHRLERCLAVPQVVIVAERMR